MELIKLVNPNGCYNLKRQNYFIFKCFFSDFSEEEKEIIREDTIKLEKKQIITLLVAESIEIL